MPTPAAVHPEVRGTPAQDAPAAVSRAASAQLSRVAQVSKTPIWLGPLFRIADSCAPLARLLRPLACVAVPLASPKVRGALQKNARRIFGKELSAAEQRRFTRQVVGSFYDFVLAVTRASRMSPP
ncbi:MAG: hypothetical protein H7210_06455, partial [Pyrinomonadaceae bacterium]|nr:hypothetical protein [Phycisphaerales bacterium]